MACDPSAISGRYELQNRSHRYDLSLSANRSGQLLLDGQSVARFEWEVDAASGQVFLHGPTVLLELLNRITHFSRPPGVQRSSMGFFGVTPECRWGGKPQRLSLDPDGQQVFRRIPGASP